MIRTRAARWLFLVALIALGCDRSDKKPQLADLPDLNEQTRLYVTIAGTRIRTGPGTQFRAVAEIGPDAKVNVVGRDGDWVLIVSRKGNAPGYIEMASVAPWTGESVDSVAAPAASERTQLEKKTADIAGPYEALTDTQVRGGPGLHYPVVADISKGTRLNVVEQSSGWYKVESKRGNKPGYVEASLARPAKR